MTACQICGVESVELVSYPVLDDHDATLRRCVGCGFMFVENPTWLDGTFSHELNDMDLGAVDRCQVVLDFVEVLARTERVRSGRMQDWGGGYGLMTRMARDRGLDCVNFDPYVRPLFAGPAQVTSPVNADITVASEVFLHLRSPLEVLRGLLELSPVVVVTAVVPPRDVTVDWWYLMPSSGQHVAFFPTDTLVRMAELSGAHLVSDGRFFHVYSRQRLRLMSRLVARHRVVAYSTALLLQAVRMFLRGLGRGSSLTPADQLVVDKRGTGSH